MTSRDVFVGRDPELGVLHGALTAAAAGRPMAVLLEGEAGVGKSALLGRLEREKHPGRPARLRAVRVAAREGQRYDPLTDAAAALAPLRRYGRLVRRRRRVEDAGALAAEWLGAIPGWGEVAGAVADTLDLLAKRRLSLPPALEQDEGLATVARAARRRPLVLLLDDLDAADEAAVRRLHTLLGTAPAGTALLVVAAYRPAGAAGAPHAVQRLRGALSRDGIIHVVLRPLGPPEVAAWARLEFEGAGVSEGLIERIVRITGGYPAELARLRDTGSLAPEEGVLTLDEATLAHLAEPGEAAAALERLAPEVSDLLRLASVCSERFTTAELASRLERDEVALEEPLSLAAHYGVLENEGEVPGPEGLPTTRYRFRSPRLRAALART
ncbi:MAG TPA: ATP-binding protein [Longimicrobiales bacterium]|nr:ATP-binding protein [Longimicrobiales bacterium]